MGGGGVCRPVNIGQIFKKQKIKLFRFVFVIVGVIVTVVAGILVHTLNYDDAVKKVFFLVLGLLAVSWMATYSKPLLRWFIKREIETLNKKIRAKETGFMWDDDEERIKLMEKDELREKMLDLQDVLVHTSKMK